MNSVYLVPAMFFALATGLALNSNGSAQLRHQSWPVAGWKQVAATKGPRHVIRLSGVTSLENFYYRLDIYQADGKTLIQSESIRNGTRLERNSRALQVRDFDGDGYQDIAILGGYNWLKVMRFNPGTSRFVWDGIWNINDGGTATKASTS